MDTVRLITVKDRVERLQRETLTGLEDCRVILPSRLVGDTLEGAIKSLQTIGLKPHQIIVVLNDWNDEVSQHVRRMRRITPVCMEEWIDSSPALARLENWDLPRSRLQGKGMAMYVGMLYLQSEQPDLTGIEPVVFLDTDLTIYKRLDAVRSLLLGIEPYSRGGHSPAAMAKFAADPNMDNRILPFLGAHPIYGKLAGVSWPLCGQVALRWGLLKRLRFGTGYSVEMAMLMGVWDHKLGLDDFVDIEVPDDLIEGWDYFGDSIDRREVRTQMLWTISRLLYACASTPLSGLSQAQIQVLNRRMEAAYWRRDDPSPRTSRLKPLDGILPSLIELLELE